MKNLHYLASFKKFLAIFSYLACIKKEKKHSTEISFFPALFVEGKQTNFHGLNKTNPIPENCTVFITYL